MGKKKYRSVLTKRVRGNGNGHSPNSVRVLIRVLDGFAVQDQVHEWANTSVWSRMRGVRLELAVYNPNRHRPKTDGSERGRKKQVYTVSADRCAMTP